MPFNLKKAPRYMIRPNSPRHSECLTRRIRLVLLLLALSAVLVACGKDKDAKEPADPTSGIQPQVTVTAAPAQPVDAVKVAVDQSGLVRITAEQLKAAGFDPQIASSGLLSLTLGADAIPFVATQGDGGLDVVFYGQPSASRYSRDNVYWLRRLPEGAPAIASSVARSLAAPGAGEPALSFTDHLRLEESTQYLSQTPAGTDHWLGQSIFAPGAITKTFDLPGWAGGEADLAVSFWANTEAPETPDHHLIMQLNGVPVVDTTWDGKGWKTITTTVAAETLRPAGNQLALVSPGDTEAIADVVYLDRIDVDYPRTLEAETGQLQFSAQAGQPVAVKGIAGADALLWDVTEPDKAQPLTGFAVDGDLRFQDDGATGLRSYVAANRDALLSPKSVQPALGKDLRQNAEGADYIAITAGPAFEQALQPLVDLRRSQGMRVTVASVQDIYDTFSHGMPDPGAIRDYMIYARDHWTGPAPRFLLLAGDASYDYLGYVPGGTPNYVPTYLLGTHFVGETASDNWFVSLDQEDDKPDMAVGRIPAQTPEQIAAVVAKTLAYEQDPDAGQWAERALFVADDKQADFQTIADTLAADYLPKQYQVEKVYLGQVDDPHAEIVDSLRQGVGVVTYVGHGSMNVWAKEKILQTDDVSKLDNKSLPFMMTMTCLVGYFHHPTATSMGEALLFKPDGGIVAGLVPTSETLASDQSDLAESVYSHLFGDAATVGEAIMLGKRDLPQDRDIMQDLIETFTLLGDPALKLHRPS